jgi:predicted aconitase with swiveling domain
MKGRRLSAKVVEFRSGRGSVVTGICYSLPEGGVAFLGQLLQNQCCAQAAGVGLARLWSRPVSVDRLTVLPVLEPGSS